MIVVCADVRCVLHVVRAGVRGAHADDHAGRLLLLAKQVCKGVYSRVEYRDMAGKEYKHGPMDMVNDLKLLGWENKVTERDDAMTLL